VINLPQTHYLNNLELIPMILTLVTSLIFMFHFTCGVTLAAATDLIDLGRWNDAELEQIIISANRTDNPGERIVVLSSHFLNTPYAANTLIGGPQKTEQLVINLAGFDCFTLLDVIEALRHSRDVENFSEQLKQVRYRDGKVAYKKRRHFFSDWVADETTSISDVTTEVGQGWAINVPKRLNRKSDGTLWLLEIAVTEREIYYIPTRDIDTGVLSSLQSGDYVGIYSDKQGLDVSHTGLIIKSTDQVILRHASSRSGVERVVDENLLDYLQGKPGLIVYRVKP
jgi:hypothetical protein